MLPVFFIKHYMVRIENLTISFEGFKVFDNFSLVIGNKEMICIKGGSGSGKTTLMKAIMGFVPINSGEIIVDDIVLNEKSIDTIRKKIAWIPQELTLPFEWVSEMINVPFSLKANKHVAFNKEELLSFFYQLGLSEALYDKKVNEISGGQRQRIMIAVSTMLNKDIMILDEPTSALDPVSSKKVISFLQKIKDIGKTIIIVSHDIQVADECDRVITLN